ncbi:MAG: efflux RND transporter periplasmic adaptor subunit [Planctomycetota bacterium]|nr:efflux RND transporter periplasmic adaptor subunit [Planctomycetota bacterium]MDA1179580.1 efflux RND transporter periplasmic adaptor subunit [Planctomycetota bacterium]
MKTRKWTVVLLLGTIAAAVFLAQPSPRTTVQAVAAIRGTIHSYVEERGMTRLPEIHQITMPLQGRIQSIELKEGDPVNIKQIVARMDTSDLDTDQVEATNTVKRYSKNLEQVELAIQQAEQTVVASREEHKFHEIEFARIVRLLEKGSTTESAKNQAELKMIEARTDLRKDELNLSMYVLGRGIMELMHNTEQAKLEKVQRDRRRTDIHSPVSGVVLSKAVSNERVLQAGTVLLEIGDPAAIEVEADLLSEDVVGVKIGNTADIEGPAIGAQPVPGTVHRIFPQGFKKVSSLGVEQQRVKTILSFTPAARTMLDKSGHQLGIDYRVSVKIYTAEKSDAIVVPRTAIFRSEAGVWQVFVVRNEIVRRTDVQIGLRNPFLVEVTSGIQEGEMIVVAPESGLTDGQRVEAMVGQSPQVPATNLASDGS